MRQLLILILILSLPISLAIDFDDDISSEDKETFDKILEPVMKIYNLIKYVASTIAVIVLLFSGINYIISGSNPGKREQAKSMAAYVIIGLIIIWAAPIVVNFVI